MKNSVALVNSLFIAIVALTFSTCLAGCSCSFPRQDTGAEHGYVPEYDEYINNKNEQEVEELIRQDEQRKEEIEEKVAQTEREYGLD